MHGSLGPTAAWRGAMFHVVLGVVLAVAFYIPMLAEVVPKGVQPTATEAINHVAVHGCGGWTTAVWRWL